MSDEQHEPSYYEIALTGRQVTGAFVVVLVSLLVAFFSGVWIGRGAPRENPAVAAAAAEPETTPKAGNELSFFTDRPADPPAEPARPETRPQTPAPAPVTPPPVSAEPEPEPEPTPAPAVPSPAPARVEEPAPPPEPKPEPKAETPPKPAPSAAPVPSGPLVIQVFTSSDEAKARDMLKKLQARSFKAYLSPTKASGRTVYRVRVGPFQKEADAKTTSDKIEKQFKVETWITRSP